MTPRVPIPRTAIVPAAGLGTRFLPATKTVPKELLPVVDTPGIELVAAEAAEAGAERLVIITSEGKDSVVAHFVEDLVLEGTLEARGKKAMLAKVRRAPALIKVESVVQHEPLGLGHAVSCVEPVLSPDEDAVLGVVARRPGAARPACWRRWPRFAPSAAARCCAPSR